MPLPSIVNECAGEADLEEEGVCDAGVNSLKVAGVDSRDRDFLLGDLFIAGVVEAIAHAVLDSTNAGLRKTARTCFSDIGSLVCSTLLEHPLEEAGTKIEFINVSINAGITG